MIPREDEDVSAAMREALEADGVAVIAGVGVAAFARTDDAFRATLADGRAVGLTACSSPSAGSRGCTDSGSSRSAFSTPDDSSWTGASAPACRRSSRRAMWPACSSSRTPPGSTGRGPR